MIWNRKKKAGSARALEGGWVDMHCHVLPGIDDGARDLDQAREMLRIACEEGIHTMVVTPHQMPGKGKASAEKIKALIQKLQRIIREESLGITLYPGSEYYFREELLEALEEEQIVSLGNSDCVLIEFEPSAPRQYIIAGLKEVLNLGYTPVLAHVERYTSLLEQGSEELKELKKLGVLIQSNASAILGRHGRTVQKQLAKLLKEELLDFVATDAHSSNHRAPRMEECAQWLYGRCTESYADRLLFQNAEQYLRLDR